MANRFLDTNYYKSPFVRSLKGSLKGLYSFIICDCTPSGIWSLDLEAASMYIGFVVNIQELKEFFIDKKKLIDLGGGKFFFPDFIEHQYPAGLQSNNKAHKNIISELKRLNLINDENEVIIKKNKGASKGLQSPPSLGLCNGQGNGQGQIGGEGGNLIYDAEKEILASMVWLEGICMSKNKSLLDAKESLRKFHLYLEEYEKYPRTRKSILAGFEKWLLNEKQFLKNGSSNTTSKQTGNNQRPDENATSSGGYGRNRTDS